MDLAAFERLLTGAGRRLLATLPPYDAGGALPAGEAARRAGHDPALVAAALTQTRLRSRAAAKFGTDAGRMYFTPDGLEQATRPEVAARRAERLFRAAGGGRVADLCCGIGGDLIALAGIVDPETGSAGGPVSGFDVDPLVCAVATANLAALGLAGRAEVLRADVRDVDLAGVAAVLVDPARRAGGRRTHDPSAYRPTYDEVLRLLAAVPAGVAKLAPGIAHDLLPAAGEAEWVSVGGDVVECALWVGGAVDLVPDSAPRRATLLSTGTLAEVSLTGDGTRRGEVREVGRYLYEPDGAVIRAGLVAEVADLLGGGLIDPSIAYVTSDRVTATPFARGYEVRELLPFSLRSLRAALRERGVGRLTIKKRGSALVPETLRRQLRLHGDAEATIVLTRIAGRPVVLLVDPLA